ncbi:hypothetical protein BSL78_28071 [Apostichopus japonicus]|uniref:Uncharacterized protein n=1 Tax=Stichopus japonicus TaxID=307972 RepID=A0A2G8JH76_STIJA|nr:hypothetical protein BSL78_28071 [Apostichopus japonicus]
MRDAAEMASEQSFQKLIIRGRRLNVKWGKSFAQQDDKKKIMEEGQSFNPVPGLPAALPLPPRWETVLKTPITSSIWTNSLICHNFLHGHPWVHLL